MDDRDDQCYVRNSSFLSRDIEKKAKDSGKVASPPIRVISPPRKDASPPKKEATPNTALESKNISPPTKQASKTEALQQISVSEQKKEITSPPLSVLKLNRSDSKTNENSVTAKSNKTDAPVKKEVTSPPVSSFKVNRTDSKAEENSLPPKVMKRDSSLAKEGPAKTEKLSLVADKNGATDKTNAALAKEDEKAKAEEKNGVGDKIKKFEKAAEDASSNTLGRVSCAGSLRRARADDFPPPATPFKDNVHFDIPDKQEHNNPERQSLKNASPNPAAKWQRSDSHEDKVIQKPEPQKIIKPEFKPLASGVDVTIRSPSLGAKVPEQFPSHGTAFRNVASPDQARNVHKLDDPNTQNLRSCKKKEKYSVSKGSSYFTRGSEEIWLVKKKDIEEIEERVLDSFRRAGGNICMRSESVRPSSDSGQGASLTMGRSKRQMYARSESLDPQWAGARAQTLKRQTSVACTCGHDKKPRAKPLPGAGADTARPRSRSHGDDAQAHVLDKYETLV